MRMKANLLHKPINFQMDDCQIEKVVELSSEEFSSLTISPWRGQSIIAENNDCVSGKDGSRHCLLVIGEDCNDGILIESAGADHPYHAAYVPGMRDIVNAEMDRAADYIIRQGVENTGSGSWCVYFEELERDLGLKIQEGSGLDELLLDALYRREEVESVELTEDCIDTNYYTRYCLALDDHPERTVYLPDRRKAELFDNAAAAVLGHRKGAERYAILHDSFGLTIQEIRDHQYLTDTELTEIGAAPQSLLENGMRVRALLQQEDIPAAVYLSFGELECLTSLRYLAQSMASSKGDFSDLLDAQVSDIRQECFGTSLMLDDAGAEALMRFKYHICACQQAEQAMGPMM